MVKNQKTKSVSRHNFAMNPSPQVPRSTFPVNHGKKIPFNFSDLVPIFCETTIPGDTWNVRFGVSARTAVPIVPLQDNWRIDFFAFNVPFRLVWTNANKFFGEQDNPSDSTAYTIPTCTSPVGGYAVGSIQDYMGLPTVGQVGGAATITHNNLPFRAANLIWNEWFRDENLQSWAGPSRPGAFSDGPDTPNNFVMRQRGKRFDYITQALPWPQKGNTSIPLPMAGTATVKTNASALFTGAQAALQWGKITDGTPAVSSSLIGVGSGGGANTVGNWSTSLGAGAFVAGYPQNLYADLSTATSGPTLNAFRLAVAMQQMLEQDARGGTRYNEWVWANWHVRTGDARLNRPEFIGSGFAQINTTAIPQTSATGLTGGTTPAGTLAASGYAGGGGGFVYSAVEHGYILVFACATADLTYQQGKRRMWDVSTRYDFPVPLLTGLGEQTLLNKEIYCTGTPAQDDAAFGYVPRWDEYRFIPSSIHGIYRSTAAGTIDYWHSSQKFTALPTLNSAFITDDAKTVVQRNFAAGAATLGQQILADFAFEGSMTRALPLNGIPGLGRI